MIHEVIHTMLSRFGNEMIVNVKLTLSSLEHKKKGYCDDIA